MKETDHYSFVFSDLDCGDEVAVACQEYCLLNLALCGKSNHVDTKKNVDTLLLKLASSVSLISQRNYAKSNSIAREAVQSCIESSSRPIPCTLFLSRGVTLIWGAMIVVGAKDFGTASHSIRQGSVIYPSIRELVFQDVVQVCSVDEDCSSVSHVFPLYRLNNKIGRPCKVVLSKTHHNLACAGVITHTNGRQGASSERNNTTQ